MVLLGVMVVAMKIDVLQGPSSVVVVGGKEFYRQALGVNLLAAVAAAVAAEVMTVIQAAQIGVLGVAIVLLVRAHVLALVRIAKVAVACHVALVSGA